MGRARGQDAKQAQESLGWPHRGLWVWNGPSAWSCISQHVQAFVPLPQGGGSKNCYSPSGEQLRISEWNCVSTCSVTCLCYSFVWASEKLLQRFRRSHSVAGNRSRVLWATQEPHRQKGRTHRTAPPGSVTTNWTLVWSQHSTSKHLLNTRCLPGHLLFPFSALCDLHYSIPQRGN